MKLFDYIKLFRVHQYLKNVFIFAPLFFSFAFAYENIFNVIIAFILFSISASAVYIFNDLLDVKEDRKHPTKCERPLAKGTVSPLEAKLLIVTMSLTVFVLSFLFNQQLFFIIVLYMALNIAYTLKLKHIAVLDVFIIAFGFVLRIFAGSVVTGIHPTHWIILITFLLALFLAFAKRRDDVLLSLQGKATRKNIDGYNLEFINAVLVLMGGVIIVSYILYTLSSEVVQRIGSPYLYLTSLFVILGILRYMQITFVDEKSGSPTKIVLQDTFIQVTLVSWVVSFLVIAS